MKKLLIIVAAALLTLALVAGCAAKPAQGGVKTGLGVVTSISSSKDAAADAPGLAQADSVIAAVTVDASGKILSCVIDTAQSKANFGADGLITTPLDTEFPTKLERGADYGMKVASSIGKEWNEQAEAFAKYVTGKTAAEVKGIAVSESGNPTGSDLTASVTVHITEFVEAVEKAVANAADLGAAAGDSLRLSAITSISGSKNAEAGAAGQVQFYTNYTALTLDASGKITSCILDASQAKVDFDAAGVITADLAAPVSTKNEIKEGYGMKAASGIGKEWYEQAAAFAKYVTGKTAAEVSGIALTEQGNATSTDITASVTIHVNDFISGIAKAAK